MFEQLNSLIKGKDTSWAFLLILLPSDIFIYIFSCFHLFTLSLLLVHPFSIFYVAILTFQFSCPNNYFYKKNTAIMLFFIEVKEVKEKAMSLVILIIEWSEGSMSRLILIYQLILTRYQNSGKKDICTRRDLPPNLTTYHFIEPKLFRYNAIKNHSANYISK